MRPTCVESPDPQYYHNVHIICDDKTHPDLVAICQLLLQASGSNWYALYFQKDKSETLLTNYHLEWVNHYYSHEYDKIDYARDRDPISIFPKLWGHQLLPELSHAQKKLFLEATDLSINEGISFPLFYGQIHFGILALSRRNSPFSMKTLNLDYGLISQGLSQLIHEDNETRRQIIHDQIITYLQSALNDTSLAKREMTRAKCYLTLVADLVQEHPELLESNYFIQKTLEIFTNEK